MRLQIVQEQIVQVWTDQDRTALGRQLKQRTAQAGAYDA